MIQHDSTNRQTVKTMVYNLRALISHCDTNAHTQNTCEYLILLNQHNFVDIIYYKYKEPICLAVTAIRHPPHQSCIPWLTSGPGNHTFRVAGKPWRLKRLRRRKWWSLKKRQCEQTLHCCTPATLNCGTFGIFLKQETLDSRIVRASTGYHKGLPPQAAQGPPIPILRSTSPSW